MEETKLLAFAIITIAASTAILLITSPKLGKPLTGLEEVNKLEVRGNTLLIGNDCHIIPMVISTDQKEAISRALNDKKTERPLTHQLFANTLDKAEISLDKVVIHSLENQSYRAYLYIEKGSGVIKVDSRPSDSVALALRTDTYIYIKESLLKSQGRDICTGVKGEKEGTAI
ncbi:MAG: bifunctional nuclease family protein [Candidatus Nanohaloarchaeota archaeon QJJ-9]|nr:bifunctional nuclease family protein [Candidatus Nanohaloarchaeota archaeon QJJ-9]